MVRGKEGQVWGPSAAGLQQPWCYREGGPSCSPPKGVSWPGWAARGGGAGLRLPLRCLPPPQINLLIFMRILKVILAKLRANQKGYADYKLR